MSRRVKIITWLTVLLVVLGLGFFVWNKYTGWFKLGADAIVGCDYDRAELSGIIYDQDTGNPILDVAAWVDGSPAPLNQPDYKWFISASDHLISLKAPGYEDANFSVDLNCLVDSQLDMSMNPLKTNLAGSVSGSVSLAKGVPLFLPATIYLDGKAVGSTNAAGLYEIMGVRAGVHKVTAQINVFPSASRQTPQMNSGETLKNFDIVIGTP